MARLSYPLIGLAMVVCTYAIRVNDQSFELSEIQVHDQSFELSNKTEDACGDQVVGATHRECYTTASFGIFPGFNACGDATCKCKADSVITGRDPACDLRLYGEGRHFDHSKLEGKGCACHKAKTLPCSSDAPQVCHQCKFNVKTAHIKDFANGEKVPATFPIRLGLPQHGLPEEIQGVFWLTDQKTSSSLVSFARSEDGGGLSVLDATTGVGKVRVAGDRVWSFSDLGGNMDKAYKFDLVYDFHFDSATRPRLARIIPTARNLGSFANKVASLGWILHFDMYLLQCDQASVDPNCKDEKYLTGFDQSFVWHRRSHVFGMKAGNFADAAKDYKAVQVIKADGTKLPAFQHWMDYSNTAVTGMTPGEFHYREMDNSIQCK